MNRVKLGAARRLPGSFARALLVIAGLNLSHSTYLHRSPISFLVTIRVLEVIAFWAFGVGTSDIYSSPQNKTINDFQSFFNLMATFIITYKLDYLIMIILIIHLKIVMV